MNCVSRLRLRMGSSTKAVSPSRWPTRVRRMPPPFIVTLPPRGSLRRTSAGTAPEEARRSPRSDERRLPRGRKGGGRRVPKVCYIGEEEKRLRMCILLRFWFFYSLDRPKHPPVSQRKNA